jgi:phosphohistidine phosphatase SixA
MSRRMTEPMRMILACGALLAGFSMAGASYGFAASPEEAWQKLGQGSIVLFRHATAPGTGDPAGMKLGDCSTQRNLNGEGRRQARRIGEAFRERNIAVGAVLSSQWCRAMDTARLAFPGQAEAEPIFNSFFADRDGEPEQTAAAKRLLEKWAGPGVLVAVTHQVNITALTGIAPASGEGVIIRMRQGEVSVEGRIRP